MFKRIRGFKNSDRDLPHVDQRFEFFHNYWVTLEPRNNLLFFHEKRFESHRSILQKIEDQLNHNFKNSYGKFKYFFIENTLFNKYNLFARKQSIRDRYQNIINIIDPSGCSSNIQKKNNYQGNKIGIAKEIKAIKSILLERQPYDLQVAKYLFKLLSLNKPFSSSEKESMKFLVNAFVIELFHYGYDLEFILKLPDVLIFNNVKYDFPFEKIRLDFSTNKEYEQYVKNERKSMNLSKMLEGILNLVRRESRPGFYVFKVDNVTLTNPHPIKIGNCTFYNPQIERQININEDNLHKERYLNAENFYSPSKDENLDESKLSRCNVIVKSKYIGANNIESMNELINTYQEASGSLSILNYLMNKYAKGYEGQGEIQFHKHFKLEENKKFLGYSLGIFWNKSKTFNIHSENKNEVYFNMELDFINSIDHRTEFGKKLFTVISKHHELESQKEKFNFKDLWIAWEAIAPKDQLIELVQQCFRIVIKKNYIADVKIFLSIQIEESDFFPSHEYYTFPRKTINDIGLNVPFHKTIPIKKFIANYQKLKTLVPNYFMSDFVQRIDLFVNNRQFFLNELDDWCRDIMEEFYVERNMEVHSDLRNELSTIRLKKNIVMISKRMSNMLIQFIDKRNKESFDLVLRKIKTFQDKL